MADDSTTADTLGLALPVVSETAVRTAADLHAEVLELFDACAPALGRYVRSCGLTPDAAEDVVQEAFLALYRHLKRGGARHNLRGWLTQVSYRLALKQRMRVARRRRVEMPSAQGDADVADPSAPIDAQLVDGDQQRRLRAVFRALPERDRRCLSLRAEGVRYREIARTLGISLGSVTRSLTNGVTRLSNAMKE